MSDDLHDGGFPPVSDPYGNGNGDGFPPPPPTPPVEEDPGNLPPWEDRSRYTLISGFFETIRLVIMEPANFFREHPARRNILPPVLFAVLMGVLGSLVDWIWSRIFSDLESSLDALLGQYDGGEEQLFSPRVMEFLESQGETLGLLLSPVTVLVFLFVLTGLIHIGVMIAARNRDSGFEGTLRVVAYSDAVNILILIPGCGGAIGFVWGLVVKIIGLREMHRLSTPGAILAVLLPLLICCCGVVAAGGLIGGLIGFLDA